VIAFHSCTVHEWSHFFLEIVIQLLVTPTVTFILFYYCAHFHQGAVKRNTINIYSQITHKAQLLAPVE